MDHSASRQKVVSENIANLNSPGFRARDVAQPDFDSPFRRAVQMMPAETSPMHQDGTAVPESFRAEKNRKPEEVLISRNAVNLEDEITKMAEARGAFERASTLYKKHTDMIKMSVGKPQ